MWVTPVFAMKQMINAIIFIVHASQQLLADIHLISTVGEFSTQAFDMLLK